MTERELAIDVVRRLRQAGYEAYWAGGCVRDELLGLVPADYDVATSARPEQVTALFRRTIEVGASFGVVEVLGPKLPDGVTLKVQVATFRNDGQYTDGRRPDSVTFATAEEDAQRRDFTINGMFFDPLEKKVLDFVGGQADLQARILRAIGAAHERFREDKLRLMRAVRMAARFGFPIETTTADAIRAMASQIVVVSAERITEELRKMLVAPSRAWAVEQLDALDLLRHILPEIETDMKPTHWDVVRRVLPELRAPTFELAFAALLFACPKKRLGAACVRLKMANTEKNRIEWLVERHTALRAAPTMAKSVLYPLLIHPGIAELLELHRALATVAGEEPTHVTFCETVLRDTPLKVLNPPPLLTGDYLIALKWPQGPLFRVVLERVRAAQLDDEVRTWDEAMALAERVRAG